MIGAWIDLKNKKINIISGQITRQKNVVILVVEVCGIADI